MDGGRVNKVATATIVLLSGLAVGAGSGYAADLGGNCCADLEERIAELEATTARKGNRKVSLEIYGQVNQEVLWWDDGVESNAGVYTNDNSRTRFGFRGKGKINSDWEAGYRLEVGVRTANSKRFTQDNPTGNDNPADVGFDIRDSHWYVKSKTFGTVAVGRQATATDQITEINQTQTADFSKYSDVEDTGLGLLLRSAIGLRQLTNNTITAPGSPTTAPGGGGITWRRLIGDGGDQPGEGERRFEAVKYTTPEYAGFTASAAWGEDDYWDIALRWNGEFAGLKIASGIGYGEIKDGNYLQTQTVCASRDVDPDGVDNNAAAAVSGVGSECQQFGGSLSVIHTDTGLFLNAGAGVKTDDGLRNAVRWRTSNNLDDDQTFWSLQAGVEKKWLSFGKTTVYGEYYNYDGGAGRRSVTAADPLSQAGGNDNPAVLWGSEVEVIGAGIAQGFDSAGLVLYLTYRHLSGDLTLRETVAGVPAASATGQIFNAPIEDLDIVTAGGIIKF